MLTWKEAKEILSEYAGRGGVCPDSDVLEAFVFKVLEFMLISGQYGGLRRFDFCAVKGCFTAPYELEVPIKVKINGQVANAWDKWFDYHSGRDLENCIDAGKALFEDPNYYPTAYDLPACGGQIGVLATCKEDEDSHVVIKGYDLSGREVFMPHNGEQFTGEYLKLDQGVLRYTQVTFGKITEVYKTKSKGYVKLYWLNSSLSKRGFLSDYSPIETTPQYRRFRLTNPNCGNLTSVSVLGRIRLKPAYSDDDLIPFDGRYALSLAGQHVQSTYNTDLPVSQATGQIYESVITKESEFKRVQNGQPIEVNHAVAPGRITNIVGGRYRAGRFLTGWKR